MYNILTFFNELDTGMNSYSNKIVNCAVRCIVDAAYGAYIAMH